MMIRSATLIDIPHISHLLHELNVLHQTHLPQDFKNPEQIAEKIDLQTYIEDTQKVALVACSSDKVIGFIFGEIWERKSWILKDRKIASIMDIAVAKDYQGQGIGKQLYQAFETQMKCLKAEEIMVEIYDFNKSAFAFYKSCGIEPFIHVAVKKL